MYFDNVPVCYFILILHYHRDVPSPRRLCFIQRLSVCLLATLRKTPDLTLMKILPEIPLDTEELIKFGKSWFLHCVSRKHPRRF